MIYVYVAAPLAEASRAAEVAAELRERGMQVTSHWHDAVAMEEAFCGKIPDEPEGQERTDELQKNLADLQDADVVLVLLDRGTGRCTLVEIGYALALGKRVVWLGARNLADAHPNVTYVESEDAAIRACTSMGVKRDHAKPQFNLVPPHAEAEIAAVLTFGAGKYGPDNWARVEGAKTRYLAAAMRHVNAYRRGECLDAETGLHHYAHAVCCLMFLLELDLEGCEL